MAFPVRTVIVMAAAILAAATGLAARAETRIISVRATVNLQAVIDAASAGDTLRLGRGEYSGPIVIAKPLTLEGEPGTIIVGSRVGSVITLEAVGTIVRGLEVRGSGTDIGAFDSGIYVSRSAKGALIENNAILDNLYGVYLQGADNSMVRANRIVGIREGRTAAAGNGVHLWNAPGAQIVGNDISHGRDGIYTNISRNNVFSRNRFSHLRFAIHYMYTNDSVLSSNISTGNSAGYAIMYSDRLVITDNISDGDRDYGLLLNSANGSMITGNVVRGRFQPVSRWINAGRRGGLHGTFTEAATNLPITGAQRLGPEKCVFIYSANHNQFSNNRFENCAIGIHFTAGSERNRMTGNAFVRNRNQVKYVGTRHLDWSAGGRGNYWSDNSAFDLNGDGIADIPYRPNGIVDHVLWIAPQAKILINSPAVQVIRWAQRQFPALLPGGIVDSRPLMAPPPIGEQPL
ncbi:nitrous oxide reductase family maturation protein NosD [Sphingosinicella microcystinivorans]|uniref:nitrous oxide reductase family maturation protein NosD n=1 Tax=Sphingosinicella microcystinivorans TaxID=335406 RepID=UPI0022F3D981|nr:nitrous oxide reductase family maturation protein NosD [Sphingosinicella microcystinivorans]WBX82841.1 nitrous oxide reductase family maturation protein NosD [Sphingosinicella microcystinivorans]